MSKFRTERVGSLIQQELGQSFCKELEFPVGSLVTISAVEINNKIDEANVWISVFPFKKSGQVLSLLKKRAPYFQKMLNKKLTMHFVPQIKFCLDTTEDRAADVEELINKISRHTK
ncbi:MAG: 30S ribosome-binding factor RbfA [Patescibacteria group bacterium]|nr:30S ribosome-binding factor RbfA [Patescibacteria group bacterium]MDD5121113.1 30S ribosome-binding factor RbfA [Patescibacteria group bacterium]MDD5222316.1 30S ribosome-binding factor RbfA [Patescibacteria group bacterium]MDD5395968.1 30S ribosome-binding factor RbfA [Patescibacteria group bacterium]